MDFLVCTTEWKPVFCVKTEVKMFCFWIIVIPFCSLSLSLPLVSVPTAIQEQFSFLYHCAGLQNSNNLYCIM